MKVFIAILGLFAGAVFTGWALTTPIHSLSHYFDIVAALLVGSAMIAASGVGVVHYWRHRRDDA